MMERYISHEARMNDLAEFITLNVPAIVPEYVGEMLAEATATIPTYLQGEERFTALKKRAAAIRWLKETAIGHGYMGYGSEGPSAGEEFELAKAGMAIGYVDPGHKMEIEVNPSATWIDVGDWSRDHKIELENAIKGAVKNLEFPGWIDVKVRY